MNFDVHEFVGDDCQDDESYAGMVAFSITPTGTNRSDG